MVTISLISTLILSIALLWLKSDSSLLSTPFSRDGLVISLNVSLTSPLFTRFRLSNCNGSWPLSLSRWLIIFIPLFPLLLVHFGIDLLCSCWLILSTCDHQFRHVDINVFTTSLTLLSLQSFLICVTNSDMWHSQSMQLITQLIHIEINGSDNFSILCFQIASLSTSYTLAWQLSICRLYSTSLTLCSTLIVSCTRSHSSHNSHNFLTQS